jgi:protein-disulfide isomerase
MTKPLISMIVAGILVLAASAGSAQEPTARSAAQSRADVEQIVREYILQHPEVLLESVRRLQERERAAQQQRSKEAILARQADLLQDPTSPTAGPAAGIASDGAVIVFFFDYQCPHSKEASRTVMKLLSENPKLRVVFKEFPILGPESELAAKAALAAHNQGAYLRFHEALMATREPITPATVEQLGSWLGLDLAKLKADAESPEIRGIIERNYQLARALAFNSAPTFVVGSELVRGAADAATLQALIAKAQGQQPSR